MFEWLTGKRKRDEAMMMNLMRAAAEGDRMHRLRQAIATVSMTKLDADDASKNAAIAAAALTTAVVEKTIGKIDDDDDVFLCGLFAFIFADYFSNVVAANFVLTAFDAVLRTIGTSIELDEIADWFTSIMNHYNKASSSGSKPILAIGQTCERWYKEPTAENFERLTKLFKLCREHITTP